MKGAASNDGNLKFSFYDKDEWKEEIAGAGRDMAIVEKAGIGFIKFVYR